MAADAKILERIDNLLRLAAPDSGASEGERDNAAREILRLIFKHDLAIRPATARHEEDDGERIRRGVWVPMVAPYHVDCSHCHDVICPNDRVWGRVNARGVEYRHNFTCGPNGESFG